MILRGRMKALGVRFELPWEEASPNQGYGMIGILESSIS